MIASVCLLSVRDFRVLITFFVYTFKQKITGCISLKTGLYIYLIGDLMETVWECRLMLE